jgi:glutamate N-acetyltransferase/amino-acid N-acetyltransferase
VVICKERCRLGALRAVVTNSGNANAATGGRGLDAAAKMQGAASAVAGVPEDQVAVCSTGVIGVQLDVDPIMRGLLEARGALSADGDAAFSKAIQTTDAFEKRATIEVDLPSGTVRLAVQAKGAGMIEPRFATLLVFVQTDAALAPETADLLLGVCVKRSFDRISVDGQLSTNDTAILMCSGASGVRVAPETEDELRLGEAMDVLMRQLALMIVADGEGARRVGRVVVSGADHLTEPVARAIANSPLVKTALHGGDPNFGRILQAAGMAYPPGEEFVADLEIEGRLVVSAGEAVVDDLRELEPLVAGAEVEYRLRLPGSGGESEVFFSDLSSEYVVFNSAYTS